MLSYQGKVVSIDRGDVAEMADVDHDDILDGDDGAETGEEDGGIS